MRHKPAPARPPLANAACRMARAPRLTSPRMREGDLPRARAPEAATPGTNNCEINDLLFASHTRLSFLVYLPEHPAMAVRHSRPESMNPFYPIMNTARLDLLL